MQRDERGPRRRCNGSHYRNGVVGSLHCPVDGSDVFRVVGEAWVSGLMGGQVYSESSPAELDVDIKIVWFSIIANFYSMRSRNERRQ